MNNNTECAKYFKSRKSYRRCLEALRKKWKSFGRVGGRITLKDTSEEERRVIGGILGKSFCDKNICFSFAEFEQGLQKTRFAPVDMKEVLEAYFEEKLSTNQGQKEEQEKKKCSFFDSICEDFRKSAGDKSMAFLWILAMESEKKYGYQQLVREYNKDPRQAEILAKNVGNALIHLNSAEESCGEWPLAVFAAKVSGNPHYFDRGTAPGQLLLNAICYWKKAEFPEKAHQWREILSAVGIVPDNISSIVHVYEMRLQTKDGWHPAYDAFCDLNEPYVVTMENLRGIIGVRAEGERVYVVENEMVFSYLLEHAGRETKLTLLCTSGQFRVAALELIPLILNSGADIYYSGDIDPDGIGIADRLWLKFGNRIHIWRMSPADYATSISRERIADIGLAKLENVRNPLLQQTAECVKEKRIAAYQENLLDKLLGDIMSFEKADKKEAPHNGGNIDVKAEVDYYNRFSLRG